MPYRRTGLRKQGILSALELRGCNDGEYVRTAGCVIARQRPGTAKGFIFLSMEDESGIANVIRHTGFIRTRTPAGFAEQVLESATRRSSVFICRSAR